MKRCKTGKRRFDELGAKIALAGLQSRDHGEQRYYRCQFCRAFHLTSQDKKEKAPA